MSIMKFVKKVPGGFMVIPLLIGIILNTFAPQVLKIGGLSSAVFSSAGTNTAIAIALVCIGSQLNLRETPEALKRGTVLLVTKFLAGALFGYFVGKIFGPSGILGISSLAIISSVTNSNGGLFLALTGEYGDNIDTASQSVLNINDGPFLTLIALGASGMADIPLMSLLAAIGPILVGCILGNLDTEIRKFLQPGVALMIPFFSFCLGAGINLGNVVGAGFSGILLGLMVVVISGIPMFFADRYINKRPGYAAIATSSAAGNSVATPAAVALVAPQYLPYVEAATAQIASAVVVTAILVPLLTAWVGKKYGCPGLGNMKTNKNISV